MIKESRASVVLAALAIFATAFCLDPFGVSAARLAPQRNAKGTASKAYITSAGGPERKAIKDALRGDQKVVCETPALSGLIDAAATAVVKSSFRY